MRALRSQKGVVLLQVLTMAIILGAIAMMLIQWQYGRYVAAYKMETGHRAKAIVEAALNQQVSTMILAGNETLAIPVTITVRGDPVFGDCAVRVTNVCGSGFTICAQFDPCSSDCSNPCL